MLHKLSSRQGRPSKKRIFGHVNSLIGENVIAAYSEKFPRATAYTLWLRNYCKKIMWIRRIRQSSFSYIQTR